MCMECKNGNVEVIGVEGVELGIDLLEDIVEDIIENNKIHIEMETKVCKTCGVEKPVGEFDKRDKGYYRTSCKVCSSIKRNNIIETEKINIHDIRVILDNLFNRRTNYLNDILSILDNDNLDDIVEFLSNIQLGKTTIPICVNCQVCGNIVPLKLYEYKESKIRYCSNKCFTSTLKGKKMDKGDFITDWMKNKGDFIRHYIMFGLNQTVRDYNKNPTTIIYWLDKFNVDRKAEKCLLEAEIIEVYAKLLTGELLCFPNGFSNNKYIINTIIKHLIKNILKWDRNDICNNLTFEIFEKYKLDSIVANEIKDYYKLINDAFPEYDINKWEIKRLKNFHYDFWEDEENVKLAFKWLKDRLYEDLKVKNGHDLANYNLNKILHDYNLQTLCFKKYNSISKDLFSDLFDMEIKNSDIITFQTCNKCNIEKPLTLEYYPSGNPNSLFDLKLVCKECIEELDRKGRYAEKGIIYNTNENEIDAIKWYEYYENDIISCMPKCCYTMENFSKIIRHLLETKLNIYTKEDIINVNNIAVFLSSQKLNFSFYSSKLELFKNCYPEFDIIEDDLDNYNDERANEIISNWIKNEKVTIDEILINWGLQKRYDSNVFKLMVSRNKHFNMTQMDMFIWYFKINNILSENNNPITVLDFINKARGFWNNKENRMKATQNYCENECEESILLVINDNIKLKAWISIYFTRDKLQKMYYFNTFKMKWYNLLIESYPIVKTNKILFEWEWYKNDKTGKSDLKKILNDLVLYRINDIVKNIEKDLPTYLNGSFMRINYPKIDCYIYRGIYRNYYEWACDSFPEYSKIWTPEQFGLCIAFDGSICGSKQELYIYEYIKLKLKVNIKSIGNKRRGKYVYELDDNYEYTRFCPDFVIEEVEGLKLKKPIILEYYGWFCPNNQNYVFKEYCKKTLLKEQFYKGKEDIHYIGIFPEDIKDNFSELTKKLVSFFMSNFNINIKDILNTAI